LTEGGVRNIATNGKPDASLQMDTALPPEPDEYTMVIAALLPLALHPAPRDVANIGFGSGLTTHALLGDARLRKVDTVEIEPAMYEGSKSFRPRNERAYSDPRAAIHFEDARTYFSSHDAKYDIIISEPSNPWVSGVASLFSAEFYRFVPRHLNSGGLFVQWMQLYEIDDELVATVGNTLAQSFRDFRAYQSSFGDFVIVASPDRELGELDATVLEQPDLRKELERLSLRRVDDLRFRQLGDKRSLAPFFAALSRRVNSDYYPVLSLVAPRTRFRGDLARGIAEMSIADLPLLRALGGIGNVEMANPETVTSLFRATSLAEAHRLAGALGADAAHAGAQVPEKHETTKLVLESAGRCAAAVPERNVIDALVKLGGATIPFLSGEALEGLWAHPHWLHCDLSPVAADVLSTLTALSRGEYSAAGTQAEALLAQHRGVLSDAAADYLLRVAMLGAATGASPQHTRELNDGPGQDIPLFAGTVTQRVWLLAHAAARRSADSGGTVGK
jgi:hypothetical protein